MTRHNWYASLTKGTYVCIEKYRDDRKRATCRGCGASIGSTYFGNFEVSKWLTIDNPHTSLLDDLDLCWHKELRPMAELACLVEESNDQA